MHRGYDEPMPTIALTPHGLPPSSQVRTRVAKLAEAVAAGEPLVERRAGDQAEAVAVGVELGDVDRCAERVVPRLADAGLELAGQILGQLSAGDLEVAVRHLGHGVGEARVGEARRRRRG